MAAVAPRMNNSPGLNTKTAPSPKTKKVQIKSEEPKQQVPSIVQPEDTKSTESSKDISAPTTNAPLAPPPKPNPSGDRKEGGDYFGGQQGGGQSQNNPDHPGGQFHFSKEPNVFENAFGAPSDTPGKPQLPGVTSLTSPAPLLGGSTPGWPGSLRSGPLSPAMLTGPANNDYFSNDHHFAGSFPTPNESSLRTGLTPGGGGSMFPQPSPNSQAIYNAMQSGGATPGTLDFHRTAMHARAASQQNTSGGQFNMPQNAPTSQPQDPNIQPNLDGKGYNSSGQQQQQQRRDQFEQHDTEAANGLFMLAQARQNQGQPGQYPPPQQQPQLNYMQSAQHMQNQMHQNDNSSHAKRAAKNSVGSNLSSSTQNNEDHLSDSGGSEQAKPQSKGRGKKGSNSKVNNGRRKADETPSRPNKRQKSNNGSALVSAFGPDMDDDDSDMDMELPEEDANGKKLTDEEKRKNFLERNRIAALKCRQRKKQWLANLQQKVEIFSTENDALAATVTQLREEIVGLKTLLLAHKDCPVSQAQGINGMAMQNITGDQQQYANPYGMGMQQGMSQHQHNMQQSMQRR